VDLPVPLSRGAGAAIEPARLKPQTRRCHGGILLTWSYFASDDRTIISFYAD